MSECRLRAGGRSCVRGATSLGDSRLLFPLFENKALLKLVELGQQHNLYTMLGGAKPPGGGTNLDVRRRWPHLCRCWKGHALPQRAEPRFRPPPAHGSGSGYAHSTRCTREPGTLGLRRHLRCHYVMNPLVNRYILIVGRLQASYSLLTKRSLPLS